MQKSHVEPLHESVNTRVGHLVPSVFDLVAIHEDVVTDQKGARKIIVIEDMP